MTLRVSLQDLEQALSASTEDFKFAYQVNSVAMQVHEDIWEELPEKIIVQDRVLPLMRRAYLKIPQTKDEYTDGLKRAMKMRIKSCSEYLRKPKRLVD